MVGKKNISRHKWETPGRGGKKLSFATWTIVLGTVVLVRENF